MREIKLQVYSYNELNERAKQKALEVDLLDDDWSDWIIDEFKEKLEKVGINNADIVWDLYNNYVSIDSNNVDILTLAKQAPIHIRPKLLNFFLDVSSLSIENGRVSCETNGFVGAESYPRLYDYLEQVAGLLENSLDSFIVELQQQCLCALEEEYDHLTSDEYKEEYFEEYNNQFYSDGRLYELHGDD